MITERLGKRFVLTYHSTPQEGLIESLDIRVFRKHLVFLKNFFHFVGSQDFFNEPIEFLERSKILLTLDDGFKNNGSLAAGVLEELGIPAIFFVSSRHSETGKPLWFQYLKLLNKFFPGDRLHCLEKTWDMSLAMRKTTMTELRTALMNLKPHPSAIYLTIEKELPSLKDFVDSNILEHYSAGLSESEIIKMSKTGIFEFGIHTVDHPYLSFCNDEEIKTQISVNQAWITKLTGKKCSLIAYPFGNYDERTLRICQTLEIDHGFAEDPKLNILSNYEIPRIGIYRHSRLALAAKIFRNRKYSIKTSNV